MTSPSRSTRPALVLPVALVFLALLWSALWLFLSNRAAGALDGWIAAERTAGRDWTCPDRAVGGYPFGVTIRCAKPTFHGEVAGRTADGSVMAAEAGVSLGHPRRIALTLTGPLILRSEAEDFAFAASWDTLALAADGLGTPAPAGTLATHRLAITLQTATQGDLNLRAATLSATASPVPGTGGDARFSLEGAGLAFPTLDSLPGLEQPTDLTAAGTLTKAALLRAPTRARLDDWRSAGGRLDLASLTISKGALHGDASGTLGLDDAHRPAGRLDTSLSGFEPIAQHYGIPLAGVRLGGLVGSLLGGTRPAAAAPGAVSLPLLLQDGRVSVGPVRTGVRLDPWY